MVTNDYGAHVFSETKNLAFEVIKVWKALVKFASWPKVGFTGPLLQIG